MRREVTVLRPYGDRIREKVFTLLEKAKLHIDPSKVLSPKLSDDEIVEQMRGRRVEVLLIPFHALRDAGGKRTNGVELLQRLEAEVPESHEAPVLMPVSMFGSAAVSLMLNQDRPNPRVSAETSKRVLVLEEDHLDDPDMVEKIRRHVHGFG